MRAIQCDEGVAFSLDATLHEPLRRACLEVERRIRPSFVPILEERAGEFAIRGVIGTLELRPGVVLDVAPKATSDDDWIAASLDLLLPATSIAIAGDRRGGLAKHRNLLDVLAAIYAERLTRALRRDGPLLLMERRAETRGVLKGKLRATDWTRRAVWQPHRLPIAFQELTADNAFSRAMAHIGILLASATRDPRVRGLLFVAARDLRPGAPEEIVRDPQVALRRLPPQWGAYEDAWDIAVSILSRKSLLEVTGQRRGVSLAVEAWRLLETLLRRALLSAVRHAKHDGVMLAAPLKHDSKLLEPHLSSPGRARSVEPDGRLTKGGATVATFEAKYARGLGLEPPREHVFQALATAAACGSPLAVLVYPDNFAPVAWTVRGFSGQPSRLLAIGLHLFAYRRGDGDQTRGQRIYELLDDSATPSAELAA